MGSDEIVSNVREIRRFGFLLPLLRTARRTVTNDRTNALLGGVRVGAEFHVWNAPRGAFIKRLHRGDCAQS